MKRMFISTDLSLINFAWLCPALKAEYWGKRLTDDQIKERAAASLCFGVYELQKGYSQPDLVPYEITTQIAYASVLTDKVSISLLGDVIVDKERRRQGVGTVLMNAVLAHADVKRTICLLGTKEAWRFYEKFGFGQPAAPMMQRDPI